MTSLGRPAPTRGELLGGAVAMMLTATGITLMYLSMRAVMGVGGSCAEGGPYQIAVHCPDGSAGGMILGIFIMLGGWFLGARFGEKVGGFWASMPVLGWAGLFISLGWNFLDEGINNGQGIDPTGLFLGLMFWAMGFVPLIGVLLAARNGSVARTTAKFKGEVSFRDDPRAGFMTYGEPAVASHGHPAAEDSDTAGDGVRERLLAEFGPTVVLQADQHAENARSGFANSDGPAVVRGAADAQLEGAARDQVLAALNRDFAAAVDGMSAPSAIVLQRPGGDATDDAAALAEHLEKLAALRSQGLLSEAEFAAAKVALLKAMEGGS